MNRRNQNVLLLFLRSKRFHFFGIQYRQNPHQELILYCIGSYTFKEIECIVRQIEGDGIEVEIGRDRDRDREGLTVGGNTNIASIVDIQFFKSKMTCSWL